MSVLLSLLLIVSAACDNRPVLKIGDRAPEISGSDIYGEPVSLDRLKGKIVVIYFWTNSCCGDGVKLLEPLYRKHQTSGVRILAINAIDSKKDIETYARENALTFTVMRDEHSTLLTDYFAVGLPTVFILDGDGIVREKVMGHIPMGKLDNMLGSRIQTQRSSR